MYKFYISVEIMWNNTDLFSRQKQKHPRSRCGLERSLGAFHSQREVNKVAKMIKNVQNVRISRSSSLCSISTCSSQHFWNFRGLLWKLMPGCWVCRSVQAPFGGQHPSDDGQHWLGVLWKSGGRNDESGKRSEPRIWRRVKIQMLMGWAQLCQWNWNSVFLNIF